MYADRAKKAAKARWEKERSGSGSGSERDIDRDILSIASSMLQASPQADAIASECERVYEAYPKKVGRPAALKAITKAIKKHGLQHVLQAAQRFAAAWKDQPSLQYCPHPATWFNQERYNDDPSLWKVTSPANRQERRVVPDDAAF
jgi:hypothetical protein